MTTHTFYSSSGDALVLASDASWATLKTTATGSVSTGTTGSYSYTGYNGSTYQCYQTFLPFDTSAIDDAHVVDSATLSLYGNSAAGTPSDTLQARYLDTTSSNPVTDSFLTASEFAALTLCADKAGSGWSVSGYNAFTERAGFAGVINKTGTTRLVVVTDRWSSAGSAPSSPEEYYGFYLSELSGTSKDPKLVVVTIPSYNESVSESGSAADTTSAGFSGGASVAESVSAADTTSGNLSISASVAESVSAADTTSGNLSFSASVAESVSAADTASWALTISVTVAEATSAADTVSSLAVLAGALTEISRAEEMIVSTGTWAEIGGESAPWADASALDSIWTDRTPSVSPWA